MSRYRLQHYELEDVGNNRYLLKFPVGNIYAKVVDQAFPNLNKTQWKDEGHTWISTILQAPSAQEIEGVRMFFDLLKKILLLCLNNNLIPYFSGDELDQCFALDYNFKDKDHNTYTEVGALEYAAKYRSDNESPQKLSERLVEICGLHPNLRTVNHLAAVPGNPGKAFNLPDMLVTKMCRLQRGKVRLNLSKEESPPLKNLSLKDKIASLKGVYALNEDINGHSILVVDDLYQSGTTMWTLARFLKENGAKKVYGLTCVKSWRDSDNQ